LLGLTNGLSRNGEPPNMVALYTEFTRP